jgi:hypothetical protein
MWLLRELPMLDNIGVVVQQNCHKSWGVQIPRTDSAGGEGDDDSTMAPSKGKGKAVQVIASDDEVSPTTMLRCRGD